MASVKRQRRRGHFCSYFALKGFTLMDIIRRGDSDVKRNSTTRSRLGVWTPHIWGCSEFGRFILGHYGGRGRVPTIRPPIRSPLDASQTPFGLVPRPAERSSRTCRPMGPSGAPRAVLGVSPPPVILAGGGRFPPGRVTQSAKRGFVRVGIGPESGGFVRRGRANTGHAENRADPGLSKVP